MNNRNILHHLLPQTKKEIILLCSLVLFYFSYSYFIITQTSIIDNPILGDLYFSFDNNTIYKCGYQSIPPHPLLRYLTSPIIFLGDLLIALTGNFKAKTFLWVLFCNYMIASSVLFIFKYLNKVISLDNKTSTLIAISYAITPINLMLCFTPESFTISVYIITFVLYYTAYHIKSGTDIPIIEKVILSTTAAGITITNFVICTVPYLFFSKPIKSKIKDLAILGGIIGIILIWITATQHLIADTKTRMEWFTHTSGEFYKHVIDLFWGSPIFSPELWIHKLRSDETDVISMDYYNYWWQYLMIFTITGLIIFSFIKKYKNKYVQILFLILIYNIFIHVIIKYGLDEPFMFGAHWVYIVPLLLGWLYKSFPKQKQAAVYLLYIVVFIAMLVNNIYHLYDFIETSIRLFPI